MIAPTSAVLLFLGAPAIASGLTPIRPLLCALDAAPVGVDAPSMTRQHDSGLELLIERSWRQEDIHQLVLRELLLETPLARALGLWDDGELATVLYEPFRGLFDLALGDPPRILIELKVGADLSDNQRGRQRLRAIELAVPRVYVLLGPSFFMALEEPDARNIGVPELAVAIRTATDGLSGAIGDLAAAYLTRLKADAGRWDAEHDPGASSGLDLFRIYRDMAAAWPVETRPSKATHPGGIDWIINGNAWTRPGTPGWEPAEMYWEMVNGRMRFKFYWRGDEAMRCCSDRSRPDGASPARACSRRGGGPHERAGFPRRHAPAE